MPGKQMLLGVYHAATNAVQARSLACSSYGRLTLCACEVQTKSMRPWHLCHVHDNGQCILCSCHHCAVMLLARTGRVRAAFMCYLWLKAALHKLCLCCHRNQCGT